MTISLILSLTHTRGGRGCLHVVGGQADEARPPRRVRVAVGAGRRRVAGEGPAAVQEGVLTRVTAIPSHGCSESRWFRVTEIPGQGIFKFSWSLLFRVTARQVTELVTPPLCPFARTNRRRAPLQPRAVHRRSPQRSCAACAAASPEPGRIRVTSLRVTNFRVTTPPQATRPCRLPT